MPKSRKRKPVEQLSKRTQQAYISALRARVQATRRGWAKLADFQRALEQQKLA